MKKNLLLCLCFLWITCYGQDLYFTPLEKYGINQMFPFGYPTNKNDYKEYAKDRKNKSKIKDNPYISNVYFYENKSKTYINGIGIDFRNKKIGEEFISNLNVGDPELYTSVSDLGYMTHSSVYYHLYFNEFVIKYSSPDHIDILCYDYAPYIDNFDEFEKLGTSFLDIKFKLDCGTGTSNSNFIYFSKSNNQTISFSFSYVGANWMFANEVTFLLDNGDTFKIPLRHSRNLDGLICQESCIADLDFQQANILSKQQAAKYKISGEKFNAVFALNPALISSLYYTIECYNNKKWINK